MYRKESSLEIRASAHSQSRASIGVMAHLGQPGQSRAQSYTTHRDRNGRAQVHGVWRVPRATSGTTIHDLKLGRQQVVVALGNVGLRLGVLSEATERLETRAMTWV
jgi:hypothetical protein